MGIADKAFVFAGIASLAVLIAVSSCEDNVKKDVEATKQALESTIEQEQWRVTYFYDGKAQAEGLNGLTFRFKQNGGVIATDNAGEVMGVWSAFDSKYGLKVNLEFETRRPFDQLNHDWIVVERSDSHVLLEDFGSGKRERLRLERV